MDKYIVTSFDDKYWNDWGTSWVASLLELAKFKHKVLIINMGDLSYGAQTRLKSLNFTIIPSVHKFKNPPLDRFATLSNYCRNNPGHYAYWEADVYFQTDVDEVFEGDRLTCCANHDDLGKTKQFNTGFISAPHHIWNIFGTFLEFAADFGNISDQNILNTFIHCFDKLVTVGKDKWNCTTLTNLQWNNGFYLQDELVNVVHPAGPLKYMVDGREYLFSGKYKSLYEDWYTWLIKGNNMSARSILKKTGKHLLCKKKNDLI